MYQGSNWKKIDLHLHTIHTNVNSHYSCTMDVLAKKIVDENLKVVGITNYFCVHKKEIDELSSEIVKIGADVTLIPNFEFRITERNKSGEYINIHILFNPDTTTIEQIHKSLSRIPIANTTGKYCNKEDLEALGYTNVTITLDALLEVLTKDFQPKVDFLFAGVNKGYGGFCPGNKGRDKQLAEKIDRYSHLIFSSQKTDRDFFLNKTPGRQALGLPPKPLFICSDAHKVGDIGSQYTWIKSDATFEGLKQCLYEPEFRVHLEEDKPREPLRQVKSIEFKFPKKTVIAKKGSSHSQDLCIKHCKNVISFSPYFTSIIGGRGTGKSTIINLLAECLGIKTDFFNKGGNQILVEGDKVDFDEDITHLIEINGTDEIEFVSQGKVERLAESEELTKLIFNERIKEVEEEYPELESKYENHKKLIDENIELIFESKRNYKLQKELEKEKAIAEKIVASIQDPKYKELNKAINEVNRLIQSILLSKQNYLNLLDDLKDVLNSNPTDESDNAYAKRVKEITELVLKVEELSKGDTSIIVRPNEFAKQNKHLGELYAKLKSLQSELRDFLLKKGTSEESIKDSQKAASDIARLTMEIEALKEKISQARSQIKENEKSLSDIESNYKSIEKLINKNIDSINSKLKSINDNVQEIKFTSEFNIENYKNQLFQDFYNTFKIYDFQSTHAEKIKEVLFLVEPDKKLLTTDYKTFNTKLEDSIRREKYSSERNYVKIIESIFESKGNYYVYSELIKKHLYNFSAYMEITGFYGNRELENCSFGQRCTAVIVTMLMTGVKPLVIDEPEAHLDNKLIADYLVELIKNKKLDRQIIFATHNSNFVVNGDSELIHILEIPDNSLYTNVTQTSIENLSNREKLLKLEGGKDAFIIRENKYGIYE